MALTDNITGYWKLDGNSNDSVASANGVDTGITYSAANGKIIQGAGFNGTTSRINLGTGLAVTGGLSISVWLKSTTLTANGMVFSKSNNVSATTDSYYLFAGRVSDSSMRINCFTGDGTTNRFYEDPATVSITNWTHIVMTYDLTNFRTYVNGALSATSGSLTLSSINTAASRAGIGAYGETPSLFFNGAIDEPGLWSRALTAAEITTLYNGGAGLQYPFTTAAAGNAFFMGANF